MTQFYRRNERLTADPELLFEYMDGIPSEDLDNDFDGYVDNPIILNDGEATSSFQNYSTRHTPVPDDTILLILLYLMLILRQHQLPYPFVYPVQSLPTMPTPTVAQMFSAATPISTVTPE